MKFSDRFLPVAGVYVFRCNINGKYYIGESLNIQYRISDHLRRNKQIIDKAIKKHEVENFDTYVEYFPNFEKNDLLDLEEALIKKFKSLLPHGYNVCSRGKEFSVEFRQYLSKCIVGRKPFLGKNILLKPN